MTRLLLALVLALAATPARAVTLGPIEADLSDTYLWAFTPNSNYGSATIFGVGSHPTFGGIVRALISFDISSIPVGSTVTAATFEITCAGVPGGTADSYYIRRLTRQDWVETQATWNKYATGNGSACGSGGDTCWATAGGDYTTTDQSGPHTDPTADLEVETHSDSNIVAQVQTAVDFASDREVHFIVMRADEGVSGQWNIYSDDHATASRRPTLTVTYTEAGLFFTQ